MAIVITQTEMIQYLGKNKAVFPVGTILTPLAKDFAADNNICIVMGECCDETETINETDHCDLSREKLLGNIITSLKENAARSGSHLSNEEMAKAVMTCLERIGCNVL